MLFLGWQLAFGWVGKRQHLLALLCLSYFSQLTYGQSLLKNTCKMTDPILEAVDFRFPKGDPRRDDALYVWATAKAEIIKLNKKK